MFWQDNCEEKVVVSPVSRIANYWFGSRSRLLFSGLCPFRRVPQIVSKWCYNIHVLFLKNQNHVRLMRKHVQKQPRSIQCALVSDYWTVFMMIWGTHRNRHNPEKKSRLLSWNWYFENLQTGVSQMSPHLFLLKIFNAWLVPNKSDC